jgi:cytochrome c-type biogenesis protein CcmH/NrfG
MVNRKRLALCFCMLSGLLAGSFSLCALGNAFVVDSLDYQPGGILTLQAKGEMPEPHLESWPSGSGSQQSLMVILSLPGAGADVATLQKVANTLQSAHPELQRFLVTREAQSNGKEFLQIVLEQKVAPSEADAQPVLSHLPGVGWQLLLSGMSQPGLQRAVASPVAGSSLPDFIEVPVGAVKPGKHQNSKVEPLPPALKLSELPKPESRFGKKQATTREQAGQHAEILKLAQELQAVINERDRLESEVGRLNEQLSAQNPKLEELTSKMALYDETIREFMPEFEDPRLQGAAVIQNLRNALIKVSTRLKATEKALEAQVAKNRTLASELAELKKDPSLLKDPALNAMVIHEPEAPSAQPKTGGPPPEKAQTAKSAPATHVPTKSEIAKSFIYKPASMPNAGHQRVVLADAAFKERELTLQAVVRENPRNIEAWLKLADLYAGRQELSRAEATLSGLLSANPGYAEGYYYLSMVLLGQNRHLEAQAALETCKRLKRGSNGDIQAVEAAISAALKVGSTGTTVPQRAKH